MVWAYVVVVVVGLCGSGEFLVFLDGRNFSLCGQQDDEALRIWGGISPPSRFCRQMSFVLVAALTASRPKSDPVLGHNNNIGMMA